MKDDTISRQAAIEALERIFNRCEEIEAHFPDSDPDKTGYKMFPDYMTVWKYLRQLPPAMNDLISRQAAIDLIGSMFTDTGDENILELWRRFRNMPSAEQRHGKWMEHEWAEEVGGLLISNYECSECHSWERSASNYCPNCGVKMDEVEK